MFSFFCITQMYPTVSQMLIINDHENTLFLELRIWFYSYFVIEKAHALKCWGREGLWLNLEYICSNHGLVSTKMSVRGELGHSTKLSSSGASDHHVQSISSSCDC